MKKNLLYSIANRMLAASAVIGIAASSAFASETEPVQPVTVVSLDPADGSTVTGLHQINTKLAGGNDLYGYKIEKQAVKVYDESGTEITYLNYINMMGRQMFKVKEPIHTPGKYSIVFPDGALYALDEMMAKVEGSGSKAFTLHYTVVESPDMAFVSATPADGASVGSLSRIVTTWSGGDETAGYGFNGEESGVVVTDSNNETVTTGKISRENSTYVITLAEEVKTLGEYKVTIPKGTFWALDADGNRVYDNDSPAVTLSYTIEQQPVTVVSLDPADGSTVTGLHQINTKLAGGNDLYGYKIEKQAVKVYDESGTEITYLNYINMMGRQMFKVKEPIHTPGKYSIVFPDGALYALDEMMAKVEGSGSKAFTLHYTVVESPDMAFVSATPADGETVKTLSKIETTWSGGDETVGYGFNGEESGVVVTDNSNATVTTGTISRENSTYVITLAEEIKTFGEYKVTIPKGTFWALDADGNRVYDNDSPAVTLSYKVSGDSGVDTAMTDAQTIKISGHTVTLIGFDNPSVEVYDLAGASVYRADNGTTTFSLSAGTYIIKASDENANLVRRIIIR